MSLFNGVPDGLSALMAVVLIPAFFGVIIVLFSISAAMEPHSEQYQLSRGHVASEHKKVHPAYRQGHKYRAKQAAALELRKVAAAERAVERQLEIQPNETCEGMLINNVCYIPK